MNNENIPTIHNLDINLICEYYLGFDRQGPGNPGETLRALSFVDNLAEESHVVDLGCGTGGQTMTLATATGCKITGLDIFPGFVDRFNEQSWEFGVRNRVHGIVGSMDALPFDEGSLDLIWCEGAIYNIGFERGLKYWRRFLRPGGYVAVTENTWLTEDRPAEIVDFWNAAYPEIDTVSAKVAALQRAGYEFIAAFALPESVWADFYVAQDEVISRFLSKHPDNSAAAAVVATERYERQLWERHKAHYGYVFYIGRRSS